MIEYRKMIQEPHCGQRPLYKRKGEQNMMNQYVVIGTYPNQNKRAYVVWAENYSKAMQKLLTESGDSFISVEVIDTYGNLITLGENEKEETA